MRRLTAPLLPPAAVSGAKSPAFSPLRLTLCRCVTDDKGQAPATNGGVRLRRSLWMRMHPVERWTTLVDLGRRAPHLLHKPSPVAGTKTPVEGADSSPHKLPASSPLPHGSDVEGSTGTPFSVASMEGHRVLCSELSYAARLQLTTSLLLWIRALRDVQDTLSRVRLPYAATRRLQRYAVADVFPTRLSEHWIDIYTTVSCMMAADLNETAEQVPAPHTWNVETSETVEDFTTESTRILCGGQVLHGVVSRPTGKALLQQVQDVKPRQSAHDELAEKSLGGRRSHRARRRHLLLRSNSNFGAIGRISLPNRRDTEEAEQQLVMQQQQQYQQRPRVSDALRRVGPVSLETEPELDARYHGNDTRGEGCPLNELGESSPTPIYIHVPVASKPPLSYVSGTVPEMEMLVRHCVMAHAAILTSFYVEGRVVDFTTNSSLVASYVEWLFEDYKRERYICVQVVDPTSSPSAASLRPFYPSWCWKNTLVVVPPRPRLGRAASASYSSSLLTEWGKRIVQCAPCVVMIDAGSVDDGPQTAPNYITQLKKEVSRIQGELDVSSCRAPNNTPDRKSPSSWDKVVWVPVGRRIKKPLSLILPDENRLTQPAASQPSSFEPKRQQSDAKPKTWIFPPTPSSFISWVFRLTSAGSTCNAADLKAKPTLSSSLLDPQHMEFFSAVQEALKDRFYTAELLYAPRQSCLSPYRLERWLWECLPDNVRVVGINTSPLDVLYYYPQGVFLSQKIGNCLRYRAVLRTMVAKHHTPSFTVHPIRYAASALRRVRDRLYSSSGTPRSAADGLHAEWSIADRLALSTAPSQDMEETATAALLRERTIDYLANPSKKTWFALVLAKLFHI